MTTHKEALDIESQIYAQVASLNSLFKRAHEMNILVETEVEEVRVIDFNMSYSYITATCSIKPSDIKD